MRRTMGVWLVAMVVMSGALAPDAGGSKKGRHFGLELEFLGRYQAPGDVFDQSAAEIVAYDPRTERLFVINGATNQVDVLDFGDPGQMALLFSIDLGAFGAGPLTRIHGTSRAIPKRGRRAIWVPRGSSSSITGAGSIASRSSWWETK